jgi:tRNA(fMet)-specific endonuclease VapC
MACLDTTVLIDLGARNTKYRQRALDKLAELAAKGEDIVTTRFNVAELYIGIARSNDPVKEEVAVRHILADMGILEFDDKVAWLFAQITAYLQKAGKPAGDMDVLIASEAMAFGHVLITRNISHFENIPQLKAEEY